MRIFEQISGNIYNFMTIIERIYWTKAVKIPSGLPDIPLPRSIDITDDYLQELINTEPENNTSKRYVYIFLLQ